MDLSDPVPVIKAMIPKMPLIGKTALYHTFGVSETSKQWDLRTELTVNVIRSFIIGPPGPISKAQRFTLKDPGIKGKMWISKVVMPAPEEDSLRQALFKAIDALKEPGQSPGGFTEPKLEPVEAEWTGYRAGATKDSKELHISEQEKYTELMKEVSSPATVLYFHGGAYYLMDPASHRPTTSKLAQLTKGRVLSVRYRLAPQNAFPSAILDALLSYMTLLYPPPGSLHPPVEARHIVFSGDSAGGNLSTALLLTILEIRRQGRPILFNGQEREIPVPAGTAVNSPWLDVTHSSPSCESNAKYDYLPPRSTNPSGLEYPPCSIWPTDPPRKNIYAPDDLLCHPLVSPLAAKAHLWAGSCPLWVETGEELLADEDKYVAMTAAKQGVQVVYEEYEAMPHAFALIFEGMPASKRCFHGWSQFINNVVENPENVRTKGVKIRVKTLEEVEVDVLKLSPFTEEDVLSTMKKQVKLLSPKHPDTLSKI